MFLDIRGLKDWIKIKKTSWNGIENVGSHIVLSPNGNIPLRDEHVVFQLTHTSWLWRGKIWIDT